MKHLLTALLFATAAPAPSAAPQSGEIVPAADYHVHLIGPYAVTAEPPLPPLKVPAELGVLLDRRAQLFGPGPDVATVSNVYTDDALLLDERIDLRWMGDKERFALYFTLFRGLSTRFVPVAYGLNDKIGYVAGTVVDAKSAQRLMNFNLGLRKESDGQWRIATESTSDSKPPMAPVTADKLIADLDKAGIRRALVLSTGYYLGGAESDKTPRLVAVKDKVKAVQLENDWQAAQVARYPGRLTLACGVNPLESYAIAELLRCKQRLRGKAVKMKVGEHGDKFDLTKPDDQAKLRRFFRAANAEGMAIVIHLGSDGGFGRKEVRSFLDDIVSAAPDIPIQIAHMGFSSAEAVSAFADARAARDPLTRNLYFDLSVGSFKDLDPATGVFLVDAIRKIGLEHVLYASDTLPGDHNPPTHEHWPAMRSSLPLTDAEFKAIADNVAPYLR